MNYETFVCEACKREFINQWEHEDAEAEFNKRFPGCTEETVIVCDDCYKEAIN